MAKKSFGSNIISASREEDFAKVFAVPTDDTRTVTARDLPVDVIDPSPFQARKEFSDLEELAAAITAQGFTSRLRVRPHPGIPGRFQLVYGERRLRAALLAGLTLLPVDIAETTDAEMREIGLIENIQRRDLLPLEEAAIFLELTTTGGYTIRSLAERLGKDKGYVDTRLALLRAPQDVQDMVERDPGTVSVARRIATLPDPADRKVLINGVETGVMTYADVQREVSAKRTGTAISANVPAVLSKRQPDTAPVTPAPMPAAALPDIRKEGREIGETLDRWHALAATGDAALKSQIALAIQHVRRHIEG